MSIFLQQSYSIPIRSSSLANVNLCANLLLATGELTPSSFLLVKPGMGDGEKKIHPAVSFPAFIPGGNLGVAGAP